MRKHSKLLLALAAIGTAGVSYGLMGFSQDLGSTTTGSSVQQDIHQSTTGAANPSPTASASASPVASQDIIGVATASGQFTQVLQALQQAGLTQTLQGPGPFTVFAPTDAALNKIPQAQRNALLQTPQLLQQILRYHVVSGQDNVQQLLSMGTVASEEGEQLTITGSSGNVMVNNTAKIIQQDVQASNGIIQVVDTVLIPPSLAVIFGGSSPTPTPSASASPSVSPSP